MTNNVIKYTFLFIIFISIMNYSSIINGQNVTRTIYVDDDNISGPWDGSIEHPYQYVQEALKGASHDDTIYVYNGQYHESIIIDKTVHLIGESNQNTVINGTDIYSNNSITITSPSVIIENFYLLDEDFTIHGNNYCDRINLLSIEKPNCIIKENYIVTNMECGIKINPKCDNTQIFNNYITAITNGINVIKASYNRIENNLINGGKGVHIDNAVQLEGLRIERSNYNNITLNNFEGNGYGVTIYFSNNNQFTQNNFINGGNIKKIGNLTITIFSSNVYSYLINKNYWNNNYWDNYNGIIPFHCVTDHIFAWTIDDFFNIDWHPVIEPYDITMS